MKRIAFAVVLFLAAAAVMVLVGARMAGRPVPPTAGAGVGNVPVVVELFTSEGCSSCPSADAALRELETSQSLSNVEVIALGQHVDYWNRLGWKDPFSAAVFTERQRAYAQGFGTCASAWKKTGLGCPRQRSRRDMLNCQQATLLIERTAGRPQQVGTLVPLRVHVRLCTLCSRYQTQTLLIARTARYPNPHGAVRLRPEFKAQLHDQLQARLAGGGAAAAPGSSDIPA